MSRSKVVGLWGRLKPGTSGPKVRTEDATSGHDKAYDAYPTKKRDNKVKREKGVEGGTDQCMIDARKVVRSNSTSKEMLPSVRVTESRLRTFNSALSYSPACRPGNASYYIMSKEKNRSRQTALSFFNTTKVHRLTQIYTKERKMNSEKR